MKTMEKGDDFEEQRNEVDLIKPLKHDNIVRYFDHFEETIFGSDYFCFVCELCEVVFRVLVFSIILITFNIRHF